ncbi:MULTISPECIES: hypothetical protein [unclassified Enterococcus]|uniref:hypothetical protein n=1 Tax=unclassified Enterococcus TaxID=2608891 RepID=UPI001CE14468|nr:MULTISPECIES: hypothetical protein [unclassified Enterococcus]MCA5011397.1 hypothetical protein [Enterococcus sp. S23]MCA5015161.1 hypothetical protein [Enterococcus sp. S22(2020)]
MKKLIVIISLWVLFFPSISYAEDVTDSSESKFDSSNELSRKYMRKQVLNGKTTKIKKKKGETYLTFPFEKRPYQYFANFVLNSPANVYAGFVETIYYRDKLKVKQIYYEKNPVRTDKLGIFTTDLYIISEDDEIYHYKNVPYVVSSDQPTAFFSSIDFDKEKTKISGEIKMFASKSTYQVELFYTDHDEYHYQEVVVENNGKFTIDLHREGQPGKMYLRASDGLGNYANALDILKEGRTTYQIPQKKLQEIENSYKTPVRANKIAAVALLMLKWLLGLFAAILILLRLRVILKRRKRRRLRKKQFR